VTRPSTADDQPPLRGRSDLVDRAWLFARAAHEGDRSRGKTRIEHPLAVATLLLQEGADDELLAAALLHDVLEDTTVGRAELATAFGKDIADLVAQLSEDSSVEDYTERKARLREQVDAAGEDAARIFLADKLARLQALDAPSSALSADRLEHYRKTLALLGSHYPQVPFIDELSRRLA
jgi:GTP diphosphokinase / guanosine-3',5'-bis(diphosphate) 3'-diphosphatase